MPVPRRRSAREPEQPRRSRKHRAVSAGRRSTPMSSARRRGLVWLRCRGPQMPHSMRQAHSHTECRWPLRRPAGSMVLADSKPGGIACGGTATSRDQPTRGPSSTRASSEPPRTPAASVARIVAQHTPVHSHVKTSRRGITGVTSRSRPSKAIVIRRPGGSKRPGKGEGRGRFGLPRPLLKSNLSTACERGRALRN